jgi:hypothetical protein
MNWARTSFALGVTVYSTVACAPALDWRDVTEPSLHLAAQFPCKPQRVVQEGVGLLQCEAQGQRFVLAWRRFEQPGEARVAVAQAAAHAAQGMKATVHAMPGIQMPLGAVDWPGSGRFALTGGDRPAWVQVWARGLVFHQALVLAPKASPDSEAASLFFDSLREKP